MYIDICHSFIHEINKHFLIMVSSCNQVPGAELPLFCKVKWCLFVRFVFMLSALDTTNNCTIASLKRLWHQRNEQVHRTRLLFPPARLNKYVLIFLSEAHEDRQMCGWAREDELQVWTTSPLRDRSMVCHQNRDGPGIDHCWWKQTQWSTEAGRWACGAGSNWQGTLW